MYEPAWKQLVQNLKERGFESQYLDRLYARLSPLATRGAAAHGLHALEREILEEMAHALCRAEDKVNLALLEVDLAAEALDEAHGGYDADALAALAAVYDDRRRAAMRARWEYMVHREALGMITHEVLESLFPIPPARSAR